MIGPQVIGPINLIRLTFVVSVYTVSQSNSLLNKKLYILSKKKKKIRNYIVYVLYKNITIGPLGHQKVGEQK